MFKPHICARSCYLYKALALIPDKRAVSDSHQTKNSPENQLSRNLSFFYQAELLQTIAFHYPFTLNIYYEMDSQQSVGGQTLCKGSRQNFDRPVIHSNFINLLEKGQSFF